MSAVLERLFLNLIATAVLYGLKNTILYVDVGTKYEGVRFDRRILQISSTGTLILPDPNSTLNSARELSK